MTLLQSTQSSYTSEIFKGNLSHPNFDNQSYRKVGNFKHYQNNFNRQKTIKKLTEMSLWDTSFIRKHYTNCFL